MKNIQERVQAAFNESREREFTEVYLNEVLTSLRETQASSRRTVVLLFILVILFVLLASAAVEEVSIGPFKLSDYSLLYKLLPVAIAYIYYDLISLLSMNFLANKVIAATFQLKYSAIEANDLDYFVLPHSTFSMANLLSRVTDRGIVRWLLTRLTVVLAGILVMGALLFEAYAFFRLFVEFGATSITVWLSLVSSLLLLVLGFLTFTESANL